VLIVIRTQKVDEYVVEFWLLTMLFYQIPILSVDSTGMD
jgi:hypothetical protein